jgi:hypothetical protein
MSVTRVPPRTDKSLFQGQASTQVRMVSKCRYKGTESGGAGRPRALSTLATLQLSASASPYLLCGIVPKSAPCVTWVGMGVTLTLWLAACLCSVFLEACAWHIAVHIACSLNDGHSTSVSLGLGQTVL